MGFGTLLAAHLAAGTASYAASTNPWALPQQTFQPQANMQGGLNMGGGFSFGGGATQQPRSIPQFVAPAPAFPNQNVQPQMPPQQAPQQAPMQFGVYPPLSNQNTTTRLGSSGVSPQVTQPQAPVQRQRQPNRHARQFQGYPNNQNPYGFNQGGFNPGFGMFPGFGGFNNFGFNFGFGNGFGSGFGNGFGNGFGSGFGNGFVAPGPTLPNYGYGNYNGYRVPNYQQAPKQN